MLSPERSKSACQSSWRRPSFRLFHTPLSSKAPKEPRCVRFCSLGGHNWTQLPEDATRGGWRALRARHMTHAVWRTDLGAFDPKHLSLERAAHPRHPPVELGVAPNGLGRVGVDPGTVGDAPAVLDEARDHSELVLGLDEPIALGLAVV